MSEYRPPATIADFSSIDTHQFDVGYALSQAGAPEDHNVTRSFWYGYRQHQIDACVVEPDVEDLILQSEFDARYADDAALRVAFG